MRASSYHEDFINYSRIFTWQHKVIYILDRRLKKKSKAFKLKEVHIHKEKSVPQVWFNFIKRARDFRVFKYFMSTFYITSNFLSIYTTLAEKQQLCKKQLINKMQLFKLISVLSTPYYTRAVEDVEPQINEPVYNNFYFLKLFIRFRRKSLFITLISRRRSCIFSLSSGLFVPGYRYLKKPRDVRKRQLEYIRSLKKKDKKLFNKKIKIRRWKCSRYSKAVKLYMLRYCKALLQYIGGYSIILIVRGLVRKFKRFLWELFLGPKKGRAKKNIIKIKYVVFLNKYLYNMSVRAIKKRISRRFGL